MSCPNCGGSMIGDGHCDVRHCEFANVPMDLESDAGPVYCNVEEEHHVQERRYRIDPVVADLARPCLETDRAFLVDYDGLDISYKTMESWASRAIRMLRRVVTYVVCK